MTYPTAARTRRTLAALLLACVALLVPASATAGAPATQQTTNVTDKSFTVT